MKKLVVFLAFAALTQMAFAQIEVIPRVGATMSYFNEDLGDEELNGRVGLQAGIDLRAGDRIFLQPGIHYFSTKNRVEIGTSGNVDSEADFKVQGFRVPFVVGVGLVDAESFDFRLFGGGTASLLINRDKSVADLEDLLLENNFWSLTGGIAMDFGRFMTLDLRHDWAMSNVFDIDDIKSRNNFATLSLGVRF